MGVGDSLATQMNYDLLLKLSIFLSSKLKKLLIDPK
jgi:hypothetical protein